MLRWQSSLALLPLCSSLRLRGGYYSKTTKWGHSIFIKWVIFYKCERSSCWVDYGWLWVDGWVDEWIAKGLLTKCIQANNLTEITAVIASLAHEVTRSYCSIGWTQYKGRGLCPWTSIVCALISCTSFKVFRVTFIILLVAFGWIDRQFRNI